MLQRVLAASNPYAALFTTAGERLLALGENARILGVKIVEAPSLDPRTQNRPTANEVGVLIEGLGDEHDEPRQVIMHYRNPQGGNTLKQISELHQSYLPLRYVLLLPYGEPGWHPGIPLRGNENAGNAYRPLENAGADLDAGGNVAFDQADDAPTTRVRGGSTRVTLTLWHAFYLHFRRRFEENLILRGGRLFQEWIVDACAAMEQNNLRYVRMNQSRLRSDLYCGLADAVQSGEDLNPELLGKRMVLPSTFKGSPRQMTQLYQDAMAIVRHYGKPDIFITMTCNAQWPEITVNLLPGQAWSDRPDLVSRVFRLKLQSMMNEILKHHVLGKVVAYIYTIEYQKRGLPHAHILLILEQGAKIKSAEEIDSVVSAQIPDPNQDAELYETASRVMLHGPCGAPQFTKAPCFTDGRGPPGKCSKRYPHDFRPATIVESDGYPLYARPDNGRKITKRVRQADGTMTDFDFDNRRVVPYNPYLLKRYDCHINVELCSSVKAVKYLYKYVYKGPDRAMVAIDDPNQLDEPRLYLDARYIGPAEACWKILGFKLHDGSPSVIRLQLHLPREHSVIFDPDANLAEIVNDPRLQRTTLTEYFTANEMFEEARELPYYKFPLNFTWNAKIRKWTHRVRDSKCIGRVYFCGPKAGERYYLRLLLHHRVGATSFENLRTVNNITYDTFRVSGTCRHLLPL